MAEVVVAVGDERRERVHSMGRLHDRNFVGLQREGGGEAPCCAAGKRAAATPGQPLPFFTQTDTSCKRSPELSGSNS